MVHCTAGKDHRLALCCCCFRPGVPRETGPMTLWREQRSLVHAGVSADRALRATVHADSSVRASDEIDKRQGPDACLPGRTFLVSISKRAND